MKSRIFTFLLIFMSLTTLVSNVNATIITATATGNWSATAIWDGGVVPTSADSVIVPSGKTVTIDVANQTCHGITVQSGGIVIQSVTFNTCFVTVNAGGVYKSSGTSTSGGVALQLGFLDTTPQEGNFLIQNDGQFGGSAYGTNDGIGIFYSERATSVTIQGSASGTAGICYLQRILPTKTADWTGTNNFDLNIKQNIILGNNNSGMGLSLQDNKAFNTATTRSCTIFPGCTVKFQNGARFHANNAVMAANLGNIVYNIYGTLDLNGGNFDIYNTSYAGSTQSITVNVGNGADYAVLKLGRTISLKKYFTGQSIVMNWNNPKSRICFGGNGAITIASQTYGTAAYVDDIANFPSSIRNISYENNGTGAGLVLPKKVVVTDTLYYAGYGNKLYAGSVIDATAKSVTLGRLFTYNNNAYVVTAVTPGVTTVSNTTLGTLGTWVKGTTVTDAAGNSYYCDSVGVYASTVQFVGGTPTLGAEFTGAPIQISGNVNSSIISGQTARFSAAAYINGNTVNGAGTMYFAKNSSIGGSFINNGTVTLAGDLETGDLTNNGTLTLSTRMLTLNGGVSGNAIDASTGVVQYGGTADRTIAGFTGNAFGALKINTSGTISLGGATTISGALTLSKGKLAIGNNDVTPGSLIGGSSAAYVVTNGTGKLILTTVDATAKLFPVGISSTSYDPVTVTPVTGTATAVKVSSTLSGTAVYGVKYNPAEWDITPAVTSSTVLAFTPSVIDNFVGANTASPLIGHFVVDSYVNNNAVVYTDGTFTGTFETFSPFVTGANINTTGIENITKFSIYTLNGSLHINGISANDQIAVYSMNGQLVTKMQASGTQAQIDLQPGVYVLRINAVVSKITL